MVGSPLPLLEEREGTGGEVLALRPDGGLRLSSAPVKAADRQKTYIVATYTGELDEQDKNESWYVDPDSPASELVPPEELTRKEREALAKKGYYTKTDAATDASVWVEMIGTNDSSGPRRLTHGPTMRELVQSKMDDVISELLPKGLRFEEGSAVLSKKVKRALNAIAEILIMHPQVLRVDVEGYRVIVEEENAHHPVRDHHPMESTGVSRALQVALDRARAVREYLREQGVEEPKAEKRDFQQSFTGLRGFKRLKVVLPDEVVVHQEEIEAVRDDPTGLVFPDHVKLRVRTGMPAHI